jgi:hypothetical protein
VDGAGPRIQIACTPENQWKFAYNVFHTQADLPEASIVHPFFFTSPNGTQIEKHQRISLSKKIITRESTKRQPCQEYYASTCEDIESYQMLVEQFNCQIPFLNFGNHLRKYFQLGLKECDQEVIKKALDLFLHRNESSACTQIPVCK